MANLIKETPVLKGKDAERFLKEIASPKKISDVQMEAMKANYKKMATIQANGILKSLKEVKQIHAGKKSPISFEQFLNEL